MRFGSMKMLVVAASLMTMLAACGSDGDAGPGEGSTGAASTTPATSPHAEHATVQLAESEFGLILVSRDGMALYLLQDDTDGTSTCTRACAVAWPPLIDEAPVAGDGVDGALLGTTTRDGGEEQVTYDGHPLYGFASDEAPGDTEGQGVGDVWFVVDASGKAVTEAARTGPGY